LIFGFLILKVKNKLSISFSLLHWSNETKPYFPPEKPIGYYYQTEMKFLVYCLQNINNSYYRSSHN
jgi:hypothetical protein